jgi:dTDP-4-dehydrorhamnose 3,5-epimerase-like enzyme
MQILDQCQLIDLPKHHDPRGNLSVIEGGVHVPFDIKRVYYLYDVPGGSSRAGHGHIQLQQLFIAMSGSFDVTVDDGYSRKKIQLNRSYHGLYVPGMMWREVDNFSSGAVCLVLASTLYDPNDYYHDYDEFVAAAHRHREGGTNLRDTK